MGIDFLSSTSVVNPWARIATSRPPTDWRALFNARGFVVLAKRSAKADGDDVPRRIGREIRKIIGRVDP